MIYSLHTTDATYTAFTDDHKTTLKGNHEIKIFKNQILVYQYFYTHKPCLEELRKDIITFIEYGKI